ncbi:MAG: Nramp family divalent metal transporter, partial [Gammaproteobacteria bacterium]|nr:Nramp family divalent metal transporter [Gammaproteobacteria bacterium]MBU1441054.1 Nramp family divalent metal transporter [Gammaproteobacteria bacterium]MBU2408110.1 Nramp family divalent metal transporter [Gammaproteobacteria bacterium]
MALRAAPARSFPAEALFSLPTTATAPFCPSEVRGSIRIDANASLWTRLRRFSGPGLLVAVGYMDPGNWATDIHAGSQFGFALLWVVVLSGLGAMCLQMMAARLALVTGRDLAQLSREAYGPVGRTVQWLGAEVSIIAC